MSEASTKRAQHSSIVCVDANKIAYRAYNSAQISGGQGRSDDDDDELVFSFDVDLESV